MSRMNAAVVTSSARARSSSSPPIPRPRAGPWPRPPPRPTSFLITCGESQPPVRSPPCSPRGPTAAARWTGCRSAPWRARLSSCRRPAIGQLPPSGERPGRRRGRRLRRRAAAPDQRDHRGRYPGHRGGRSAGRRRAGLEPAGGRWSADGPGAVTGPAARGRCVKRTKGCAAGRVPSGACSGPGRTAVPPRAAAATSPARFPGAGEAGTARWRGYADRGSVRLPVLSSGAAPHERGLDRRWGRGSVQLRL
jgi:hypothetical protein